jgi:hypothetical protein
MRLREKKKAELKLRVEEAFKTHLESIVNADPEMTLSRIIRESVLNRYPMSAPTIEKAPPANPSLLPQAIKAATN